MFRRKDENATDSTAAPLAPGASSTGAAQPSDTASATTSVPSSSLHTGGAGAHSSASSGSSASAPVASAGGSVPASRMATAVTPAASGISTLSSSLTEPVRTSAAPSAIGGNSYRPTPIADFTRSATPRTSEPAARPTASASSFGSAPTEKTATKTNRRVLTVGNDILLKGEIATCDRLVIEGRVEAKLSEVHTVEIAECGSFKGTAEVEDAEISGVFEGDLVVRNRLVIYATGEVRGNISYGEIEIERGGRLTGQIKTVATGSQNSKIKTSVLESDKIRKESSAAA